MIARWLILHLNGKKRLRAAMTLAGDSLMASGTPAPVVHAPPALPAGLRALAEEMPSRRVSRALRRISQRLESGEPWQAALDAAEVGLPDDVRGLIAAGIRCQRLPDALERLVDLHRRGQRLRREVWLSLAYPLLLVGLLLVLFLFYEVFFVREIAKIYEDFDYWDFPAITQMVLRLSNPEAIFLMAASGAGLAAVVVVHLLFRPYWLALVFNRLPVLGPLWQWSAVADFSRLLALLLEVELPLPQALSLTAAGMRNAEYAAGCRWLSARVATGEPLWSAMLSRDAFPESMVPIVRWGQQRSSLPEALEAVAEMFAGRVQVQLSFVRTFIPPFTFILVAGVILFSAMATLLPMIRMLDSFF